MPNLSMLALARIFTKQECKQNLLMRLEPVKKIGHLRYVPRIEELVFVIDVLDLDFVTTVVVVNKNSLNDYNKKYTQFKRNETNYVILDSTEGPMLSCHLTDFKGNYEAKVMKYNEKQKDYSKISDLEIKLFEKIKPLRMEFKRVFEFHYGNFRVMNQDS